MRVGERLCASDQAAHFLLYTGQPREHACGCLGRKQMSVPVPCFVFLQQAEILASPTPESPQAERRGCSPPVLSCQLPVMLCECPWSPSPRSEPLRSPTLTASLCLQEQRVEARNDTPLGRLLGPEMPSLGHKPPDTHNALTRKDVVAEPAQGHCPCPSWSHLQLACPGPSSWRVWHLCPGHPVVEAEGDSAHLPAPWLHSGLPRGSEVPMSHSTGRVTGLSPARLILGAPKPQGRGWAGRCLQSSSQAWPGWPELC